MRKTEYLLDQALDKLVEQKFQIEALQRRLEEKEKEQRLSEVQASIMTARIQELALKNDEYEQTLECLLEAIDDGSLAAQITAKVMEDLF